jgi:hypothetical protein
MATDAATLSKPRADLDIFPKLAGFLDPHLVIPVLDSEFYKGLNVRRRHVPLFPTSERPRRNPECPSLAFRA